ncbi:MAG: epsilon-lactone hydrolase [Mycobacterium sp.]|nr:epsilon-lactone hydrolase [Mycobacterium sp.]
MSWQTKAVAAYVKSTRKRRYTTSAGAERLLAQPKGSSDPPRRLAKRFGVSTRIVDGCAVHCVSPEVSEHSATVIYLHGGAYVNEIQKLHWKLIADVATHVGVDVWVPIYGLAPRYHAEEAIALMHKVLAAATSKGPTYLMGDSAGGGLALAAEMSWSAAGGPAVAGLTLIAPWLDIGLRNPDIAALELRDPWLSTPGLRLVGDVWADGLSPDDPRVSPLFGDLSTLPLTDLYVGDRDITVADCRLLRDKMPPGRVEYHEQPGGLHVYPLLPVPEGRAARKDVLGHVRTAMASV